MRRGIVLLCWLCSSSALATPPDSLARALTQQQWSSVRSSLQQSLQLADARHREPQLYRQLQQMLNVPVSDPALRALVESLGDYQPQLRGPANPEHPESPWVASYPIAKLARQLLHRWQVLEAAAQLQRQWRAGDLRLSADAQILTTAITRAEPALLEAILGAHSELPPPALAAAARRLRQPAHYERWLRQAPVDEAIAALPELQHALAPSVAGELLWRLQDREALRGAAILALAALRSPGQEPALIRHWIAELGQAQTGASSARALADLDHADWVTLLPTPQTTLAWQNSLLALYWSEHPAARARLEQWLSTPELPTHMRAEVSSWLR